MTIIIIIIIIIIIFIIIIIIKEELFAMGLHYFRFCRDINKQWNVHFKF